MTRQHPARATLNMTDYDDIQEIEKEIEELEQRIEHLENEKYRQFEESQPDYV